MLKNGFKVALAALVNTVAPNLHNAYGPWPAFMVSLESGTKRSCCRTSPCCCIDKGYFPYFSQKLFQLV